MYFDKSNTIKELKHEYYRLALLYHPDKGGDVAVMQAINSAYELRLRYLAGKDNEEEEYEIGEEYQRRINLVIHLRNIEVEICGKWIWVSGDTYSVKDELKAAGFWWASQKKKWYWRPSEGTSRSGKPQSMDWIRARYGSTRIDPEPAER